jgi:hypothetical protein
LGAYSSVSLLYPSHAAGNGGPAGATVFNAIGQYPVLEAVLLLVMLVVVVTLSFGWIQHEFKLSEKVRLAGELDTWTDALDACLGEWKSDAPLVGKFSLTQFEHCLRCQLNSNPSIEPGPPGDVTIGDRWHRFRHPAAPDKLVREAAAIALFNFERWTWIKECSGVGFDFYYETSRHGHAGRAAANAAPAVAE